MLTRWIVCAVVFLFSLSSLEALAQPCERWVAKAVSVQGSVQALRTDERQWRSIKLADTFCPGDRIRVLKLSRADIVLANEALLRLDQNTTVTFSEPEEKKTFLITLLNGAAYFFSRIRRSLRVSTPFVNAIVEGTEFYVRVESDKAFLSIFEGQLAATNQAGSITLTKDQSAVAEADRPPVAQAVVRPRDAIQWALYYPPILYYRPTDFHALTGWEVMVRKSIEFYLEGNLQRSLEAVEEIKEEIRDPRFYIYRASLLLSVGRIDEAKSDIGKALGLSPGNSQAVALQSVIAVVQNEKEEALALAKKAVETEPQSTSARMALSYAQQALFDLKGALGSLEAGVKLEPENALAWARLAELRLSFGELDKALKAAKKAVELDPNLSRTQAVLGFAYLTQIKTKKSKEAFQKAIELDQADPLPRLGLGLAKIREGDLKEGRGEIEIAATLDPNSSLIRSYLGKAYYEEKRDKLASDQFTLAKELDPSDPTPYFYNAIRKQSINQPVEALRDIQQSILRNDNRAVFRSRLLLDADLAAREASLGRIYSDLGFQQLALVEGWKSVNLDPANYSAHRFLADSYSALPRHEIARVSELLQSQLLQPININPLQPHLAESNLSILSGAGLGPADLSFNEFNPLFERNRLALQASGIWGENSTLGDEVVVSGVRGPLSYSIGQFHYETDGFRINNDLKEDIYNLFIQGSLSYQTSLQAELRSIDSKKGDRTLNFFGDFLPDQRQEEENRSVRLGFHHAFSQRSDLIGSFVYADASSKLKLVPFGTVLYDDQTDRDNYGAELQHLLRSDWFNLISGAGYSYIDGKRTIATASLIPPPAPSETIDKSDIRDSNLYLYSQINYPKNVTLTFGVSADFIDGGIGDRNQVNPKFGLTWNPIGSTTLRAAIFRVLTKTLVTDQTIEPSQVAGFNQFFDDTPGTDSWCYGVAIDQKFSKDLYAGAEYSIRDLKVPFEDFLLPPPPAPPIFLGVKRVDWEEGFGRAYLYWTPHSWFGLSAEYLYERFDRTREFAAGIDHVKTHRFPLGINFYHPSGLSARLKATYIDQEGTFQPQGVLPGVFIPGEDQFWIFDASISYRFPKRYGLITVGAKNLFDKSFRFQETDPVSPSIQPERMVFAKFTLTF